MSRRRQHDGAPPDLLTYGQAARDVGLEPDRGFRFIKALVIAGEVEDVRVKTGVHRVRRDALPAIRRAAVRAGWLRD